ncbi:glutamine amidotransferase-related protein [Rhodobacteraceae bacterium nBUS_24]
MQQAYQTKLIKIVNLLGTNIGAWQNFLRSISLNFEVLEPTQVKAGDIVLLPGVSHANYYHTALEVLRPLLEKKCIYVIGVCAGLQILCRFNEENNKTGFNLIDANTVQLSPKFKYYNTGWRTVRGDDFFFNHSYGILISKGFDTNGLKRIETSNYFGNDYLIEISASNFLGFQYHPELSGNSGKQRFLEIFGDLNG